MKAIHIAPTSLIGFVDEHYNKGLNMVLTHLVLENEAYRHAFKAIKGEKYLDNSFFELGYCMEPEEMMEAAKMVDATVLICPDGTMKGMELFKKAGYKIMCIPKDEHQFKDFMYSPSVDLVGVSEEWLDYRHSPGARYELFRDHLIQGMPKNKIHLLGATDSIRELALLAPFREYIRSWDSSAAVWQGHLGQLLSEQKRKNCTPVDFSADIKWNLFMEDNVKFIEELLCC